MSCDAACPVAPCDGLLAELALRHPGATQAALCRRIAAEALLISDLQLESALRIVGHDQPDFIAPAVHDGLAERTAAMQSVIDRLVALTMEDGLTGLFNRRYFERRLAQELQRSRREQRPCAVCLVDADHFKRVNDAHGHALGDRVLKALAALTTDVLRATDEVTSRLGGEEFALILPGTDGPGAVRAAERVRARVEALRIPLAEGELRLTVSLGVAVYDSRNPCEPDELVRRADAALYAAKAAGRNCVKAHTSAQPAAQDEGVTPGEKDALLR